MPYYYESYDIIIKRTYTLPSTKSINFGEQTVNICNFVIPKLRWLLRRAADQPDMFLMGIFRDEKGTGGWDNLPHTPGWLKYHACTRTNQPSAVKSENKGDVKIVCNSDCILQPIGRLLGRVRKT